MSDLTVFVIGVVIFAITVYGTVMAGGIALTRRQIEEEPVLRRKVDKEKLDRKLPIDLKY